MRDNMQKNCPAIAPPSHLTGATRDLIDTLKTVLNRQGSPTFQIMIEAVRGLGPKREERAPRPNVLAPSVYCITLQLTTAGKLYLSAWPNRVTNNSKKRYLRERCVKHRKASR